MSKNRNFILGETYHIYSRGVEKRKIFLDEGDYKRFYFSIFYFNSDKNKDYLFKDKNYYDNQSKIVKIIKFKLMPNHIHFKLEEIVEGGISKFMQKLITSYTMYFNNKYSRFGSLFGTRYKCKLIDTEYYSYYLDFYIKYNCIKIMRPDYDIYKIFCGDIKLSTEELKFVEEYPYYFSGQ